MNSMAIPDLEITDVSAYLLDNPQPWLLVRIETDASVTGANEVPRTRHDPADIERLGERLVGAGYDALKFSPLQ